MDFSLSDNEQGLVETARDFVETELVPLESRLLESEERGEYFPNDALLRQLQQKARDRGLWGLQTPAEYGGQELGALATALITIETGRTFVPFDYGGFASHMLFHCDGWQRENYLFPVLEGSKHFCLAMSEPQAGSDAGNIRTTARRSGDDWIINGTKAWISFGEIADFAIVLAATDKDGPDRGITAFLVDREMGWTARPTPTMMGASRQACYNEAPPSELLFDEVRVPSSHVLGEPGRGLQHAMGSIGGGGRMRLPAYSVGHGLRLIEMAARSLAEGEFTEWTGSDANMLLAECAADIEAARWITLRAAWQADHGDPRYHISMAKMAGPNAVWRTLDKVIQIIGPAALRRDKLIERWLRQLRVYRIFAGTDEMQRRSIARLISRNPSLIGEL